jgi:membrane-associated phospholipid phosphatase
MSPSPPMSLREWNRELSRRIGTLWFLKSVGTICWIAAFFVGYFWVLRHPLAEVTIMPLTALDRLVVFRPEAVWLYVSLWVYVSIGPALLKNFRELFSYAWPTAVPPFDIDMARHPSMSVLKGVDLAGNACPSLHVAFAVFTGIWMDRLLREVRSPRFVLVLNWVWCLSIVYSTLATRQHVVLDVIAGAVLGAVVAALHLRALPWLEGTPARVAGALPRQAGGG